LEKELWTLDRIEEKTAILERNTERKSIPLFMLDHAVREGDLLYFDGLIYRKDKDKTEKRRLLLEEKLAALKKLALSIPKEQQESEKDENKL